MPILMQDIGHYQKSKGYAIHGLFANWEPSFIDNTEVRFTVANLFNRDYYPYLGESVSV